MTTTDNTVDDKKVGDMLRKVQALLARADHPNTPAPEAESCRVKAEQIMFNYRIDEAMLSLSGKQGTELIPGWKQWDICDINSEYSYYYRMILQDVIEHVGIKHVVKQGVKREHYNEDGTFSHNTFVYEADVCGSESDLQIAELLFTAAAVAFQSKMEPKYDSTLSDQVNAYLMRSAGMEGWRIAQAIYGKDDKSLRPKVRAMFKKEAEARGEDPTPLLGKGNSMKDYRESYAKGFEDTLYQRLVRMRQARGDNEHGLVLASRNERILEEFYAKYESRRPKNPDQFAGTKWEDPRKNCPKCQAAKSGYCRDHGYLRPKAARLTADRTNYTALERGRDAARTVDLGGGGGKVGKDSTKEIG